MELDAFQKARLYLEALRAPQPWDQWFTRLMEAPQYLEASILLGENLAGRVEIKQAMDQPAGMPQVRRALKAVETVQQRVKREQEIRERAHEALSNCLNEAFGELDDTTDMDPAAPDQPITR